MSPEDKYTTPEQIEAMRQAIFYAKGRRGRRENEKYRLIKITGQVFFTLIVLLLVTSLISIQVAKSRGKTPDLLGFQLYMIESGSMKPTLPIGSVILSRKPKYAEKFQEKDIVTFKTLSGLIVTHRIVEVLTDEEGNVSYCTRGDNPVSSPDPELLTPDRVIAVFLIKVPFT